MRKIFFVIPTLLLTLSSSFLHPVDARTTNIISQSPSNAPQKLATSNSKQLKINQRLWNRQKVSTYSYTLSRDCFCTPEARGSVVIKVRNGKMTLIANASTGKPVNRELFKEYDTVPKLFNSIKSAIARKEPDLTVEYNPKFGYPTQIKIGNLAADAGVVLTISNLRPY